MKACTGSSNSLRIKPLLQDAASADEVNCQHGRVENERRTFTIFVDEFVAGCHVGPWIFRFIKAVNGQALFA